MQQSHKEMEKYNPLQWSLRLPVIAPIMARRRTWGFISDTFSKEHPARASWGEGFHPRNQKPTILCMNGISIGICKYRIYISYMFGFGAWKSWDNPNIAPGSRPTTPRTPASPCIVGASNPCLPCGLSGAVYQNLPQHPWSSMKIHRSRKPSPFKLAPFEYSQVPHQSPCAIRQVLHLESSPDGWMDGWMDGWIG